MKKIEKEKQKNNFTKLTHKRGISLIVLIVTIIVIIILAAVVILTITKNNPVKSAKEAVLMEDLYNIQNSINIQSAKPEKFEKLMGKLSSLDIDEKYVEKYNDFLYVKDNKLYLDFMATIKSGRLYKQNKDVIEILNNKLEICYCAIKEYNKVSNGYFDDGLNNWGYEVYGQSSAYVKNENGNNFLHLQLNSDVTFFKGQTIENVSSEAEQKLYIYAKYRNESVNSLDGEFIVNNGIIRTMYPTGGYTTFILSANTFVEAYNNGWKSVSSLIQYKGLNIAIRIGGADSYGASCRYSADFDDIYIINLTEVFGKGNEPTKAEMDEIMNKL